MLTHITHPEQTLTGEQLGLIPHHAVLYPLCCITTGHLSSWVPYWLQHEAQPWTRTLTPCHATIHSDAHDIPISGDVPPKSSISCLCKLCFTNSAWIWGCQSTRYTPGGGVVLRLFTFVSWRANGSFPNTQSWKGGENIFNCYLPSTSVFLSSPWQHTAASCLLKESGSPRHRTAFITVQETAVNPNITPHCLLHVYLLLPGLNQ